MTMERGDTHARAKFIREKLLQFTSPTSNIVTIPRVPERLRLGENDAYEPQIISFGPYHHGKPKLQPMEKYKWQYLNAILSKPSGKPLESYVDMITEQEAKIRSCYSGDFDIGSEDFVEMVLIDGCFIVEYFLRIHGDVLDELDRMVWAHDLIKYDILLLENQLPFSIVDRIFDMAITQSSSTETNSSYPSSFKELAIYYLNRVTDETVDLASVHHLPESVHHLLHLYHSFCLYTPEGESAPEGGEETTTSLLYLYHSFCLYTPKGKGESAPKGEGENMPKGKGEITREGREETTASTITIGGRDVNVTSTENKEDYFIAIPGATVLQEAGIRFIRKEVNGSRLDITFDKGKMMIPPLLIGSSTKSKFRNLIAFEQLFPNFHHEFDKSFSAYAELMDFIVNTPEDVALLVEKGIICHILASNKDVADLFNHLKGGVVNRKDHYLDHLYKAVRKYQQKRRHRWRANLMHNYFTGPWAIFGIVAAGILLGLAILQTIFSGYSAFHSPPSPSSH